MAKTNKRAGSSAANNTQGQRPKKGRGPGKPFKPNDPTTGEKDPRINRLGAPRTFLEAREEALAVINGERKVRDEDGNIVETKHDRLRILFERWYASNDFQRERELLQYGYGKIPDEVRHRTDEDEFVAKYISVFTDGELERIRGGESGFDILVSKLESQFGNKNRLT